MKKGEAAKIYKSIFGKEIPDIVQKKFEDPSAKIESSATESGLALHKKIIDRISDLAAVEYASRILGKNPTLIKKFQVMVHLGECMPDNYDLFINEKKGLLRTLLLFSAVPFNSIYKFLKGFLILKIKIR